MRQAVQDRLILIEPEIMNKQCREFLQLRHSSQATRVLKSLDLIKLGEPPATGYHKKGEGPLKWADAQATIRMKAGPGSKRTSL